MTPSRSLAERLAIHDELHTQYPTLPRYMQHLAWDLLNLGFVLNNAKKYGEAARASGRSATIFEGLVREYPESGSLRQSHAAALTMKAIGLILTDNRGLAEQAISQVKGLGNAEETSARLAEICWHLVQGDVPRVAEPAYAVELASQAVALGPESVPAWHAMGMARYRARQWEKAIAALTKANELEHDKGLAFNGFFLAMAFHQRVISRTGSFVVRPGRFAGFSTNPQRERSERGAISRRGGNGVWFAKYESGGETKDGSLMARRSGDSRIDSVQK